MIKRDGQLKLMVEVGGHLEGQFFLVIMLKELGKLAMERLGDTRNECLCLL